MKKKIIAAVIAAAMMMTTVGSAAFASQSEDAQAYSLSAVGDAQDELKDGVYEIGGRLKHASSESQDSMGNAAMVKPFQLIKSGESYTLRIEMQKLSSGVFEGYLGKLWYFPD